MRILATTLLLLLLAGCNPTRLPDKQYYQFSFGANYQVKNDTLTISLKNPLHCPLRVWIQDASKELDTIFQEINPVEVPGTSDTLLVFSGIKGTGENIRFTSRMGSMNKEIKPDKLKLPYPSGKSYRVIQGNNTNYTHNTDWSRYAIDFDLKINDTICAATGGYVVGIVDQYKDGGKGAEWKKFGNFLTIYDPDSGLFTQYVHLVHKGTLVKMGDSVSIGQPIALSGMTGQTNIEHLHFNCLIPANNEDGMKSVPVEFLEGYIGTELRKNDVCTAR